MLGGAFNWDETTVTVAYGRRRHCDGRRLLFFFKDPATPEIYTLSLHDALPICEIEAACRKPSCVFPGICPNLNTSHKSLTQIYRKARAIPGIKKIAIASGLRYDLAVEDPRSEEHTSELQSLAYLVCRLLLEKKK